MYESGGFMCELQAEARVMPLMVSLTRSSPRPCKAGSPDTPPLEAMLTPGRPSSVDAESLVRVVAAASRGAEW